MFIEDDKFKLLKDIILEMALDDNAQICKSLLKCPVIQAELIRHGKLSLDDLADDELSKLVEHTALEDWIDNQDVMQMLHISKRTLQTLRSNGTLPFSRINGKIYYRRQDIKKLLSDNYVMYKIRNEYGKSEK